MGCEAHVVTCNNGPNGIDDSAPGINLSVLDQQITRGPASVVCATNNTSCGCIGSVNPGGIANIERYEYNVIERSPFDSGIVDVFCVGNAGAPFTTTWGSIFFNVFRPRRVLAGGGAATICNDQQALSPWRVRVNMRAVTIWFVSDSTSCSDFGTFSVESIEGPPLAYPPPCYGSDAEVLDPSGIVGRTVINPGTLTLT